MSNNTKMYVIGTLGARVLNTLGGIYVDFV